MKILFVCSANICRSALCEVILKQKLREIGIDWVEVDSAGVYDYAGMPFDNIMASYAHKEGYELKGYAKYMSPALAESADLIICMEQFQIVELQKLFVPYAKWGCIHRFCEICFDEQSDLMDPTGYEDYRYSYVFDKILEGVRSLTLKILKQRNE